MAQHISTRYKKVETVNDMAENVYLISVAKNNNNVRKSFRTETD